MSKQPSRSVYIGNIKYYLIYLPDTFPRGLEVDLEGSSTFLPLLLLMLIDRLGLVSHLYRILFNCIATNQGSWACTTALHMEVEWCCNVAISAWYSVHHLLESEFIGKKSCTPLGCLNAAYMSIYMAIFSLKYMYLNAYTSFKIIYTS